MLLSFSFNCHFVRYQCRGHNKAGELVEVRVVEIGRKDVVVRMVKNRVYVIAAVGASSVLFVSLFSLCCVLVLRRQNERKFGIRRPRGESAQNRELFHVGLGNGSISVKMFDNDNVSAQHQTQTSFDISDGAVRQYKETPLSL